MVGGSRMACGGARYLWRVAAVQHSPRDLPVASRLRGSIVREVCSLSSTAPACSPLLIRGSTMSFAPMRCGIIGPIRGQTLGSLLPNSLIARSGDARPMICFASGGQGVGVGPASSRVLPAAPRQLWRMPMSGRGRAVDRWLRNGGQRWMCSPDYPETRMTPKTTLEAYSGSRHRDQATKRNILIGIAMVLGIVYFFISYAFYRAYEQERLRGRPKIMTPPDGFADEYLHPFHSRPILIRVFYVAKRIVVVSFFFAPFLAASVLMALFDCPPGSLVRRAWLACMVSGCEQCGCAFQKFGQWLSMRPDMMPPDVIDALSKLRQDAPEHSVAATRRVVRDAFANDVAITDIFERFDSFPVASGSVAQTHRARLKPEFALNGLGQDVAVKVRHPRVVEESFIDIDIIFGFINAVGMVKGKSEKGGRLIIPVSKDEFQRILQRQIDFRWEAYNISRFRHNFFGDDKYLRFPTVHESLLSEGLLVETWIEGDTVSGIMVKVGEGLRELAPSEEKAYERVRKNRMCHTIFDMTMKMFLRDNLIHGDMHGGNVMVSPRSDVVTVIDAGLVTGVNSDVRRSYCEFLKALCLGDEEVIVEKLVEFSTERVAPSGEKLDAFRNDVRATLHKWIGPNLKDPGGGPIQLGDVVGNLLFNVQTHNMSLRGDVAGTIVSMSLVEGLVKQLDPHFDVVGCAIPYFNRFPAQLIAAQGFLPKSGAEASVGR